MVPPKLRLVDQKLTVEWGKWHARPEILGREHIIIVHGKIKEGQDNTIKTKLKNGQIGDAKWMDEKLWKTYRKEQTNNDTMCSQYFPIKEVAA